ncbi:MAG: N-acetyl-gamma-glutamyl-phosphate reductase [Proteobacteria bacterium]|nr:MAG: N-acetyl-gamma-glutamyl-phosphate reductase [Pseudomonadota bacterium]
MNVAIIGASGYTGLELIKILLNHPNFNISYIGTSQGGEKLSTLHPSLKGVLEADVEKTCPEDVAKCADLAFLALPHKTAMEYAKKLLSLNVKVVDLSADYRIALEKYEEFYCPHEDRENLSHAVYGLPELNRQKIKKASLVANPGCYPTASLLALLPFAKYVKKGTPIIIDAKSGVSGAGKKLSQTSHFVSINDNIFAYNPLIHRHCPEIKEKFDLISGGEFEINFVPHLIPITRGMLVSSYIQINEDVDVFGMLKKFYENEPFVRVRENPVNVKDVVGTNFCDIYARANGRTIFISSAIDNLLRGASSQAVANGNLMSGFDEGLGLPKISYAP